jgi:hypothetical protein
MTVLHNTTQKNVMRQGTVSEKIPAWWFSAGDRLPHGDKRLVVIGETHSVNGKIVLCENALHASRDPFDALYYAPGPYLYKVQCWGDIVEDGDDDKLGARHREYLAVRDATNMLRKFAREQALSVIHLWEAPTVVKQYLETGDETLRDAARDAALAVARDASSAPSAAWDAASAARDAAWDAAGAAARAATRDAATRDAARDAVKKRFNELVNELFKEDPQ